MSNAVITDKPCPLHPVYVANKRTGATNDSTAYETGFILIRKYSLLHFATAKSEMVTHFSTIIKFAVAVQV